MPAPLTFPFPEIVLFYFLTHNILFLKFCENALINLVLINILFFTQAIGSTGPPMAPREHLAVLDAFGCVRSQLHRTEQADALLCRILEGINNYHTDHNLLRLKATSAAALHTLTQCLAILQRTQHNENAMTASSVFYRPCPPSNTKLKEANEENNH